MANEVDDHDQIDVSRHDDLDSHYDDYEGDASEGEGGMTETGSSCFTVSSGALCFGTNNNIRYGATRPIQTPSCLSFQSGGGTVLAHSYEMNLAAVDGKWKTYPLVSSSSSRVVAWFACHTEGVHDAYEEVRRILDVANSPYEMDNGTNRNTQDTWDGRVLVINRYDWTTYDSRGMLPEDSEVDYVNYAALVDYEQARSHPSSPRDWYGAGGRGVRMELDGEYAFARFGLTPDRKAVHSFLFFTADTPLANDTTFENDERPIYKPLTHAERHAKRLRIAGSYSGFSFLRSSQNQPPQEELLGPFTDCHFLELSNIESVLQQVCPRAPRLEPQLQEELVGLLNEILCSWVDQFAVLAESSSSCQGLNEAAFPITDRTGRISKLDELLMERMMNDDEQQPPLTVDANDAALLRLVGGDSGQQHILWTFYSIGNLKAGIRYLLGEVLEIAGNCAVDNHREVLVPYDIRVAIANDPELHPRLGKAKKFYPPES